MYVALLLGAIGCGGDDPSISIVSAPVDTADTQGPYVVEAIPDAPEGVFELRLDVQFLDQPILFVPLEGEVWRARIPGQPVGSQIDWFVELVDSGGDIVREPSEGVRSFQVLTVESP